MANWWWSALELLAEFLKRLAHVRVTHVHFTEEMIRQSTIVIETTQICAANIAYLQLLMTRRARGILQILQFALARFLLVFGCADLVQFIVCLRNGAGFA